MCDKISLCIEKGMRSCQLTRGEKIGKNQRLTHHWSSFCQKKELLKKQILMINQWGKN